MLEPGSSNQADLADAQSLFQAEGLPFPPLPPELAGQVVKLRKWLWGTRKDAPSPYLLDKFLLEILTTNPPDYLLFGQAGHGIFSYALHYYLVRGPLAIFLQIPYPDIQNLESPTLKIQAYFEQVDALIAEVEKATRKQFQMPGRLAVVVSLNGGQWAWITPQTGPDLLDPWHYQPQNQTFARAFQALAEL